MNERVIRKITPGHPEASKTMSLDEASAECGRMIRDDRRSLVQLKRMFAASVISVIIQVIGFILGASVWIVIPSSLILTVISIWALRLIRNCEDRIHRNTSQKTYFEQRLKDLGINNG